MIRLFVALNIPEAVKVRLQEICFELADSSSKLRWEDKEKIHLTLKFIGEIEDSFSDPIIEEINFIKNYHSFNCKITKFGFFYGNDFASILWAGIETDNSIFKLADELNKRLEKFGIEAEKRKFKAHLTLLRLKYDPGKEFIERFINYKVSNLLFKADEIALIKSELHRSGSKYTKLKTYELN